MISSTMNRKIFAFLLILPVAVFAADRLTASNVADGGGKDKRTSKTTSITPSPTESNPSVPEVTQAQASEEPLIQTQTQNGPISITSTSPADGSHAVLTTAEKKAMMVQSMEDMQIAYTEEQTNDRLASFYQDNLDQELYKWLTNHVLSPLQKSNPMAINVERSFSRCPSGYSITLASVDDKVTNEGWLLGDEGCWDRPIGKFQYNVADGSVNVHLGTSNAMLPLQEYLTLFKASFKEG